ncbi:insulinase family protein [Paraglaciecola aquimarina]|uniref:Protease 3 n=1 Tax=Paraglaciecola aquimarina TaxID=1235557 RepID=A0ABU3SZR9_9ALTE|nr:insulinase family protein [Paraglaciecola aquimarina]MDU0355510.1 insulinase family protein [Paraglaciecola aquimarina]
MLKSIYDKRQYKYLHLDNGMRIFLVEDANCTKSACSITINSGHFNDDNDCHGQSHLLEHMLFLGNKRYPKANELLDFLSAHGGHINAQTGTEYTSFFLDCPQEIESQATAHLYHMLVDPLFNEVLIDKETNAIDAEFKLKQKDEIRRLYQVHKETCNPLHPFSKFSVGNKQTFSAFSIKQLKSKLARLHSAFYQPQNCCMCWISSSPIADRAHLITQLFCQWQNSHNLPHHKLPPLYLAENLATKISIKPLQHAKRLILTFALPNPRIHFRSKPLSILSHLLGDEGADSLLDYLKNKGWASNLSAGGGIEGSNFKDFNINIQLTDTGVSHTTNIISALFNFIHVIREKGLEPWRFEEISTLNRQMWDFSEVAKPIDEALQLSEAMFEYSEAYLLAGDYILDEIKPELSLQLLTYFTPENMRVKFIHPEVKTNKIAKWYETRFAVEKLHQEETSQYLDKTLANQFVLPQPNQFLVNSPTLKPIDNNFAVPKPIVNEQGLHLWYGQDNTFKLPKGDCFLTFDCQAINQGIEIASSKRLWIALLNEKLNKRYYQAELAGMNFHFYPHQGGFSLQTNGFSDNQLTFCTKLLTQIILHEDFTQSFAEIKKRQILGLSNALLNKPINLLFSRLAVLMQQHSYLPLDMADTMQHLTPNDVYQTKQKLLGEFHLEGLMYGNWTEDQAQEVSHTIREFRQSHPVCSKVNRGVADIRNKTVVTHQVTCHHPDPAIVMYFQAPDASVKNVALTILLEQLVAAPFFNDMRTERQLGYLVGCGYIPYNQYPGIAFYIQSPHSSASGLINAVHDYLQTLYHSIDSYSRKWDSVKKAVIRQFSEKDVNLNMKSQRFWMGIGNQDYNFNQTNRMAKTIGELGLSELKAFLQQLLDKQGFGEIIVHSGELDEVSSDMSIAIDDPTLFKGSHSYKREL